ncbi:MAG: hypothetical protein OXU31_07425, partial [Gammaproteobacteria bacterium]|nr:hypothetical protein [Gammaproteobacteria bacterium]
MQINEGDTVTLTLTANGLTSGQVFVRPRIRAGATDPIAAGDLTTWRSITGGNTPIGDGSISSLPQTAGGFTLNFTPSRLVFTLEIGTNNDGAAEGPETFVFETHGHTNVNPNVQFTTTASITITIAANDGYSRASLGGTDATLSEGATVNV